MNMFMLSYKLPCMAWGVVVSEVDVNVEVTTEMVDGNYWEFDITDLQLLNLDGDWEGLCGEHYDSLKRELLKYFGEDIERHCEASWSEKQNGGYDD